MPAAETGIRQASQRCMYVLFLTFCILVFNTWFSCKIEISR